MSQYVISVNSLSLHHSTYFFFLYLILIYWFAGAVARSGDPKVTLASSTFFHGENSFPLPLIQDEQSVSYWRKNGH